MGFIGVIGSTAEITGADGNVYTISPFGFKEAAEYLLWYQYKEYDEFRKTGSNLSPELKKKLEEELYTKCREKKVAIESDEVLNSFITYGGIAKQLYLSLRVKQPTITEDDISRIISLSNYRKIQDQIDAISGIEDNTETVGEMKPSL